MRGAAVYLVLASVFAACNPSVDHPTDGDPLEETDSGTCAAPMRTCGDRCTNLQNDNDHCGTCNNPCTGGAVCSGGECVRACASGLVSCDGECFDPAITAAHCGSCESSCAEGHECRGGECQCPAGWSQCDNTCVDIQNDRDHCGICTRSCGMERMCEHGSCSCAAGEMTCDSECVDPLINHAHCGGCDRPCGAGEICSNGSCECATGTREVACEDGMDDDCDSLIDCDDPDCQGMTRSCFGICGTGVETCEANGQWGACDGGDGSMEICGDGIDQDCDGSDLRAPDAWEPNDDCASCPMITGTDPNVYLNGSFDSVDDSVDCFRFEAYDDFGPIREFISLTLDQIPTGHDYDLYLYRDLASCQSGTSLASSALYGNDSETISYGEGLGTDDSGTYYIRVVRFAGTSCTDEYRLTINGLN